MRTQYLPRNCQICNSRFKPYHISHVYCSDKCRTVADARWKKRYGHRAEKMRVQTKTCLNCSESFTTTKARQIFCSTKCYRKHLHEQQKERRKELKPPKTCPICRNRFPHSRFTFCSPTCRKMAKRERDAASKRRANNYQALPRHAICISCSGTYMKTVPYRKTCSPDCQRLLRNRRKREYRARLKQRKANQCESNHQA